MHYYSYCVNSSLKSDNIDRPVSWELHDHVIIIIIPPTTRVDATVHKLACTRTPHHALWGGARLHFMFRLRSRLPLTSTHLTATHLTFSNPRGCFENIHPRASESWRAMLCEPGFCSCCWAPTREESLHKMSFTSVRVGCTCYQRAASPRCRNWWNGL